MDNEEKRPDGRKRHADRLCKVCQRRRAKQRGCTVCDPCLRLVTAENTFDKYGIPRESIAMDRIRRRAAAYNAGIKAGKTQHQIAAELGYTVTGLRGLMTMARKKGIEVVKLDNRTGSPIPKQPGSGPGANGHGGGRFGVTGCLCEPCKMVRRKSRKENDELRAARRAQAFG